MDNTIQNINVKDIILVENDEENTKEIDELTTLIKKYGITEPLLLKQKNDKYEVILGEKQLKVAKIIGLKTVPAIVENLSKEKNINNKKIDTKSKNKFINLSLFQEPVRKNEYIPKDIKPKQTDNINQPIKNTNYYANIQNNDIINLSELNKEEERDEFKMNNQEMQSQNMNNNPTQQPTFGGRFFPSLEDEPTNINMGGMNIVGEMPNNQPTSINPSPMNEQNNLIDLTDVNVERGEGQNNTNMQSFTTTQVNQNIPNAPVDPQLNQFNMPNNFANNSSVTSVPGQTQDIMTQSQISEPNLMTPPKMNVQPPINPMDNNFAENQEQPVQGIVNNMPNMEMTQNIPQFDMSQNIAPMEFVQSQNQPAINDFSQPNVESPIEPVNTYGQVMTQPEGIMTNSFEQIASEPVQEALPQPKTNAFATEIQQNSTKDITPVIATLKNVATSLEKFGYNITINEENLPTSDKIIIEIEK